MFALDKKDPQRWDPQRKRSRGDAESGRKSMSVVWQREKQRK